MTLKTLKQEQKNLLTLDDEFLQYCKLNNIEDVQKLAKEVFNKGFTILKYGEKPPDFKPLKEEVKEVIKEKPKTQSDNIIPVIPMKSSDGSGLVSAVKKVTEKKDLYGE